MGIPFNDLFEMVIRGHQQWLAEGVVPIGVSKVPLNNLMPNSDLLSFARAYLKANPPVATTIPQDGVGLSLVFQDGSVVPLIFSGKAIADPGALKNSFSVALGADRVQNGPMAQQPGQSFSIPITTGEARPKP
jgi:hypothetical protein